MSVQKKLIVRRHYSDCLMRLCENYRLSELKVSQIVAASGMSRQTFYNHFEGIADLVSFTISRSVSEARHQLFEPLHIIEVYQFAYQRRAFFSQVPTDATYGSTQEKLNRWLRKMAYERFVPEDIAASERLRRMVQIDLFIIGSTDTLFGWMSGGCILPIDIVATAVIEMMPSCMVVPPQVLRDYPIDPLNYPR